MNAPTSKKGPSRLRWILRGILSAWILIVVSFIFFANFQSVCGCGGKVDGAKIFVTSEIETSLLAYKTATGDYPTTQQGLKALIAAPAGATGWNGPYLNKSILPLDPWGHPYHYAYPAKHNNKGTSNERPYEVWSIGPDGRDGTADDIGNWDAVNQTHH